MRQFHKNWETRATVLLKLRAAGDSFSKIKNL